MSQFMLAMFVGLLAYGGTLAFLLSDWIAWGTFLVGALVIAWGWRRLSRPLPPYLEGEYLRSLS